MRATIRQVNAEKGFSFAVVHNDGKRVLVHASDCREGEHYNIGSVIEIESLAHVEGRGLRARGVRLADEQDTGEVMIYARVTYMNSDKGYAFAEDEASRDSFFVHQNSFKARADFLTIERGTRVKIERLLDTERGYRAEGVTLA